jgi:hypothetical protein
MMRSLPPRLRAGDHAHGRRRHLRRCRICLGMGCLLSIAPVTIAAAVGYYELAGRDSDFAAMLREQADERQAERRLKIQALVGRVTALAASAAFLAAIAAKATLWPFYIFITVPAVTFAAGWLIYLSSPAAGSSGAGR